MDCFPVSRPAVTQHGHEKVFGSDYADDGGRSQTTIFQSIGATIGNVVGSVCAPCSDYGPSPGKPITSLLKGFPLIRNVKHTKPYRQYTTHLPHIHIQQTCSRRLTYRNG